MQTQGAGNRNNEEVEIPKVNGIDYLQNVSAAAKDLINLLRSTIEATERLVNLESPRYFSMEINENDV